MADDRSSLLREAERLVQEGARHQAVVMYVDALARDPRDAETVRRLRDLCTQLSPSDDVLTHIVQAADLLRDAGELDAAASLYEWVLAPEASAAPAAVHLGAGAGGPESAGRAGDLESVFAQIRGELGQASAEEGAEAQLRLGETLLAAGRIEEALSALTQAARAPRLRFQAAALAARACRASGELGRAVQWFERAAEAPPPAAEAGHQLLYELADTLERIGEHARALANFLELQTIAGGYRDVPLRIRRLAASGTRG